MQDVVCVDEGTGNMEEVVEPWIAGIWDVVAEVWREGNNSAAASNEQQPVVEDEAATAGQQHHTKAKSRTSSINSDDINSSSLSTPLSNNMSLLKGNDITFPPALTNNTPPPLEFDLSIGVRTLNEFLTLKKYDSISGPSYVAPPGSIARLRSTMHLSLSLPPPTTTTTATSSSSSLNGPSSASKCACQRLTWHYFFHLIYMCTATVTCDTTGYLREPSPHFPFQMMMSYCLLQAVLIPVVMSSSTQKC